jgi:peptide/nickel transport system substrate-binding protein
MLQPIYEALVGLDYTTGQFVPQLAERWQVENGKDWRFFLRQGVPFHNGMGELTAEDVKFSFEDTMAPGPTNAPTSQELRDMIDRIEVVSPYEVLFVCKVPDATLRYFVCQSSATHSIMSKKDYETRGNKLPGYTDISEPPLAGTGPWMYRSRAQDRNLVLQRVPYKHWRIDADFQELEYRFASEVSSRLSALLSGEASIAQLTRDARQAALDKGMTVFAGQQARGQGVFLVFMGSYLHNVDDPSSGYKYPNSPIMDLRVRKALSKAINRVELNKIFLNEGQPMYRPFSASGLEGWNPQWEASFQDEYGYDPTAAKALLAEAGYGPGKPLMIALEMASPFVGPTSLSEGQDLLEAVGTMWGAVGVQANLETLDIGAYISKQRAFGFDSAAYVFGAGQALNSVLERLLSAHRQNRGNGFENYEWEKVFLEAVRTIDDDTRDNLLREAGDISYRQHFYVPLFWSRYEVVGDPKVVSSFTFPGVSAAFYTFLNGARAA